MKIQLRLCDWPIKDWANVQHQVLDYTKQLPEKMFFFGS